MNRFVLAAAALCCACAASAQEDPPLALAVDDMNLEWGPCVEFLPEGCEVTFLRGDLESEESDIFIRFPANTVIARHRHTSSERMVLVAGELQVTYDGHETETLAVGDYAYGPPGVPHTAFCAVGDDCVLYIAFDAPMDAEAVLSDDRTP